MDILGSLVGRDRRSGEPALRAAGNPPRRYSYREFCTTAWKTGNFLAHLGVAGGRTVAVVGRTPEALLSVFGAALLGARVRFDPPREVEARAVVAPVERVEAFDLPPGGQRVAYGGAPADPTVSHFERDVWSENPTVPPASVEPDDPVLVTAEGTYAHRDLLSVADRVARERLAPEDVVALRAPLADPGAVVAGVLAPLAAGGTILLPDEEATGTVAVAHGAAPEPVTVAPPALP